MPLMPWFHLVLIEKVCHTKKPFAGSTRQVAVSLTLLSSSPSSPSRNQKCPLSSPPPARRFHQPCKRTSSVPRWEEFVLQNLWGVHYTAKRASWDLIFFLRFVRPTCR